MAAIPAPGTRARRAIDHDRPHFVYRCFDADGELLYVGMTANPVQRLSGHRSASHWFSEVASFTLIGPFVGSDARTRATRVERALIDAEAPPYNADRSVAASDGFARRRATEQFWHERGIPHDVWCSICKRIARKATA